MSTLPDTTANGNGAVPTIDDRAKIEQILRGAINQFSKAALASSDAFAAMRDASDHAIGERGTLITTLAAAAENGHWSGDALDGAVKAVLENRNDTKGAVATFAAEIKRCCRPAARSHIADYFTLARAAFDTEAALKKADNKADTPLRRAFARAYHCVMALAKDANDGRFVASEADIVQFACKVLRDRAIDPARVLKRLESIRKELQAFHDDFPIEGISDCVEFLAAVTDKDVKACKPRNQYDALRGDASEPASEPVSEPAPESEPVAPQSNDEMLHDALADMVA